MKTLLVPWMLLLFGVSLNSGHYIRKREDGSPSVYEVRDTSSGISFVNPIPEKRTLREILYYHIIERPREEPVVTERAATNSHGFQFLDLQSLLQDSYDDKDHENEHDSYTEHSDEHGVYLEHSDDENNDGSYVEHAEDESNDGSYVEHLDEHEETDQDTENLAEDPELTTQKPPTDEEVKDAYKSRSYLFDQSRQRYAVKRMAIPDSLNRRKRQAEAEEIPEAPAFASDSKEAYMQPKTYGMNLDSNGGYVWNNLNKPPTFYDVGQPNGFPDEGSYGSQSQESTPTSSENAYIPPVSEPTDSGSSDDIYVNNNRPSAPEPVPEAIAENPENQEPVDENPEPSDSGANYPAEPILGSDDSNDKSESNEFAIPLGPEVYENPEQSNPVQPENHEPSQEESEALPAGNTGEGPIAESNENPEYSNGQPGAKTDYSSGEGEEGDRFKNIPVAPTLPPLNFDNLPGYIRDAISSTEKPESYEQTENPYANPQPNPEDKQVMEDKMEGIFATMPPVEDIPKTYGMNLSSDGGRVWSDMVNPAVAYDVRSPSKPEEEHEEQPQPPVSKQPEIHEENPVSEPTEPAEPIVDPEEPNQEQPIGNPEPNEEYENEEPKPIVEPAGESVEPMPNPGEENPEPPIPDNEDNKPIDEPAEPTEPGNEEPMPEPGNGEPMPEPGNGEPEVVPEPGNEEPQPDDEKLSEEPAEENPDEEDNLDIMGELLKSEQFWKWLGEWTSTYMELLEKHIRRIAVQEICKREKSGEQMCPLEDDPEENGIFIKDGKIIVDGKEIDMTHTDNLDKSLKKGHHYDKNYNKNKNENKVQASTIYGNSVGNEKVTNVFIFTADKADEVIDNFKPANESDIGFVIDDRIKENEDEKNKEKSGEVDTDSELNVSGDNKEETNDDSKQEEPISEDANESESNEPNKEQINNENIPKEESSERDSDVSNQEDLNKDNENKESTSGDIEESEHEIDESKLEPSESES